MTHFLWLLVLIINSFSLGYTAGYYEKNRKRRATKIAKDEANG